MHPQFSNPPFTILQNKHLIATRVRLETSASSDVPTYCSSNAAILYCLRFEDRRGGDECTKRIHSRSRRRGRYEHETQAQRPETQDEHQTLLRAREFRRYKMPKHTKFPVDARRATTNKYGVIDSVPSFGHAKSVKWTAVSSSKT